LAKLSMSRILRLSRDLGLRILGPLGTLHAYNAEDRKTLDDATGNPFAGIVTEMALFSPGPSIYGGTDEIQHNIIGERVLGLPKEPNSDKVTAFKDLPKNG
jgi:alkylation response protein AidB-like acyl-CoA dehydrogenase